MTGFYGIRGQLELALHILKSVNTLAHLTIDPMVRVTCGPSLDWSRQRLTEFGRIMAQLYLRKGKHRHMVTIM